MTLTFAKEKTIKDKYIKEIVELNLQYNKKASDVMQRMGRELKEAGFKKVIPLSEVK